MARPAGPLTLPAASCMPDRTAARPFSLLAAALADGGVAVWTIELLAAAGHPGPLPGVAWHAHEMVFGFGIAEITGFLFTAGRHWSGEPTPQGRLLAALARQAPRNARPSSFS